MKRRQSKVGQPIEISISPWYDRPLVTAIVGAAFAGGLALIPWFMEKSRHEKIDRYAVGSTLLLTPQTGRLGLSGELGKFSVELHGFSFDAADRWIKLQEGSRELVLNRNTGKGDFSAVARDLHCGMRYSYRTEAMLDGQIIYGPISMVSAEQCITPQERSSFENSIYYTHDLDY
ncbi:MAG: hypothetical protein KGL44_05250 [Sphingomonadales bacterium]|nr:hypothetical protein [Sphingomonadales bacterium]